MIIMLKAGILSIQNLKELRQLSYIDVAHYDIEPECVTHILKVCDAVWIHSDNPADPHAELTSGKHSNGFVNVLNALVYPNICRLFAHQLYKKFMREYLALFRKVWQIDWVIGSDHAGAALSHDVGEFLNAKTDFTAKEQVAGSKRHLWNRHLIKPEEKVLQVEELVTTAGTLEAVRKGIREGTPHEVTFAPFALTLVNRSNVTEIEGAPILHLVHYNIATWDAAVCPLCKEGSKTIKPKQNWAELTDQQ